MSLRETWVACNRRPLWLSLPIPLAAAAGAAWGAAVWDAWWLRGLAAAAAAAAGAGALGVLRLLATPRLACDGRDLLFYLRLGPPLRVPAEAVEVVFRGQGPARAGGAAEAANLVLRLAESRTELHRRAVQPQLGSWCDGYVTLLGAHCEPVTAELVLRLNRRLVETHRALRGESSAPSPDGESSAPSAGAGWEGCRDA